MLLIVEAMLIKPILHRVYELMLMLNKRNVITRRWENIQYLHEELQHLPWKNNSSNRTVSCLFGHLHGKTTDYLQREKFDSWILSKRFSYHTFCWNSTFNFFFHNIIYYWIKFQVYFSFSNNFLRSFDAFSMPSLSSLAFWSRPWISNPIQMNESIVFFTNQINATHMLALACPYSMSLVELVYSNEKQANMSLFNFSSGCLRIRKNKFHMRNRFSNWIFFECLHPTCSTCK